MDLGSDSGSFSEHFEEIPDDLDDRDVPSYGHTRRIFKLLSLLTTSRCSYQNILERLHDDYHLNVPFDRGSSQRRNALATLRRDLRFLDALGYEVQKEPGSDQVTRYHVQQASGPIAPVLFHRKEIDVLILLYNLFADPTTYTPMKPSQPVPSASPNNPLTQNVLALLERLVATLPPEDRTYFKRWVRKPFVYFNLTIVTDYLPHRETIEKLVHAITQGQQVSFAYQASNRKGPPTRHSQVDPYYIVQHDGHFYLFGYSSDEASPYKNRFFEFRIDRLVAESIAILPSPINLHRRQHPIEFHYWAYEGMASGEMSHRWLTQTVEREETYVENGKTKHRRLIRATAYDEWRILQQLHKYGDKVELVDPPKLREQMRQEIERTYKRYIN